MINITQIYLITNIDNDPNKVYIGKTKNPKTRKNKHKLTYGNQITFDIIDEINSLNVIDWKPLESYWIEQFKAWNFNVINKNIGGNGPEYLNKEARNKISINKIDKGTKPVIQHDWWAIHNNAENTFIKEWPSIKAASRALDITQSNITACCKNKLKRAGSFVWRYK